jgi:CheY-like chemotaxis protein
MDFAELFTASAREIVPLAQRGGLLLLFDYRGPLLTVQADEEALRQSMHRLCAAAVELVHDGFIFLTAQAQLHEAGLADIGVSVAATGSRADDSRIGEMSRKLGMTERPQQPPTPSGEVPRVATGICPITGATVSFAANGTDGVMFALDLTVLASPAQGQDPAPDAGGARAWLIGDAPGQWQSLVRRLQRLGWATSTFTSARQALTHLASLKTQMARPSLVLAAPSAKMNLDGLAEVRDRLPPNTQFVLTGAAEPQLAAPAGFDMIPWPLSPGELMAFTRRAQAADGSFSGDTMPAPLTFKDRPHALVVDDNAVNLLVASGLLQVAGFEVATACCGPEAIERCRERAPQLVLMDVHMPDMDGLEVTRRLRAMQRDGSLPHFTIVAATADAQALRESSCREAGMDGFLSKPLTLEAIERELARLVPGLRKTQAA